MPEPDLLVLSAFFGAPLVTLLHELGHAVAALLFSDGPVEVYVGRPDCAIKLKFGRLCLFVSAVGTGGTCRSSKRGMSREQILVGILAGPGMNVLLALLAGFVGYAVTGGLRGALIAIAAISALGLTNLIPRWSVSSALQMDVPSDGLQALCVIRNRPLPPQPTQPRSHRLRGPLSVKQAIGVVAGLGVAGLALRAIPGDAIYVYGGLAMQQLLDGRETSLKPSAQPDISPAKQRADEVMP